MTRTPRQSSNWTPDRGCCFARRDILFYITLPTLLSNSSIWLYLLQESNLLPHPGIASGAIFVSPALADRSVFYNVTIITSVSSLRFCLSPTISEGMLAVRMGLGPMTSTVTVWHSNLAELTHHNLSVNELSTDKHCFTYD